MLYSTKKNQFLITKSSLEADLVKMIIHCTCVRKFHASLINEGIPTDHQWLECHRMGLAFVCRGIWGRSRKAVWQSGNQSNNWCSSDDHESGGRCDGGIPAQTKCPKWASTDLKNAKLDPYDFNHTQLASKIRCTWSHLVGRWR